MMDTCRFVVGIKRACRLFLRTNGVRLRIQQQYSQNKSQKVFTPSTALGHNYRCLKHTHIKDYSLAIIRSTAEIAQIYLEAGTLSSPSAPHLVVTELGIEFLVGWKEVWLLEVGTNGTIPVSERIQRVPNSPKMVANMIAKSPKRAPTWLYDQDLAKFPLNHHYNVCRSSIPSTLLKCKGGEPLWKRSVERGVNVPSNNFELQLLGK
ncbi:hypothetical protein TNCV_180421 [Trichonephila clavipes]|nr:hypothetical protein TNCV_180421 [Trichonephila clavipes]